MRSAGCQAEDKAGKLITSWQKSVIRKERLLLSWLSTPPPAVYPSPLGWRSLEIPAEQPPLHLSYLFTRRHLQVDKKGTACSDFSSPCLREAQPAAQVINPWDNPIKTNATVWGPLLFKEWWWSATWAATFTKPGHHCKETNFIDFGKGFSIAANNCLHFRWQFPYCFLDGVATTFSVDSVNILPYFSAVFIAPPSKRLVRSFSFCLFAKLLLHTGRREHLCYVPSLFFFCCCCFQ